MREFMIVGTGRGLLRAFLVCLTLALSLVASAEDEQKAHYYDYGGASAAAVVAYRQGWVEILEYGRWTEAERLYRKAVKLDPGFFIAKSVLARISRDATERDALYRSVQENLHSVDASGRLILDVYQKTLELFAAREAKTPLAEGFREQMVAQAVTNYRRFLDRYPGEWSVVIEYLEWVHAAHGSGAALLEIEALRKNPAMAEITLSYFPASFYAELGDEAKALQSFKAFSAALPRGDLPQRHYALAYLNFYKGDYLAAKLEVDRSLVLDPKHLLAERLLAQVNVQLQSTQPKQ